MDVVVGILATVVVAYIAHRRQAQESQKYIALLVKENQDFRDELSRLPQRVVDRLVAQGFIDKTRESDVRARVMEDFPSVSFGFTATAEDVHRRPTDVSGRHVIGPSGPTPGTR